MIEITADCDSVDSFQTRRRTLDIMANAANNLSMGLMAESLISSAWDLAVTDAQRARVALVHSSIAASRNDHDHVLSLISEKVVDDIVSSHSATLGAAALIKRADSLRATDIPRSELDIQRASDIVSSAINEGPRIVQRLQLLEVTINVLIASGSSTSISEADAVLNEMRSLANIHGAQHNRIKRVEDRLYK
ncbi:hypothetical protein BOX37_26180 [Nocardia mangyaensis]|uniref:Uncharacterized protein n=1 Tax=Nocardia mangyaensis TaxID=2213200 RepID=A0A1J0VXT5_9NOCA|nr:hypothetical protein BOX37_26180 [Nocardia mangyaensis]